jgi:lysophospholipase L1-like esterase
MKSIGKPLDHRFLQLRHKKGLTIVSLGDSLSFGVGDVVQGKNHFTAPGWPGRLAHDLAAVRFLNFSRNGARVRDLVGSRLNGALEVRPDLTVICIGGNDVLRGDFDPAEIYSGLLEVITRLDEVGSAVVLAGLPHRQQGSKLPKFISRVFQKRINQLNQVFIQVCDESSAHFVQLDNLAENKCRDFWHVDRMHPSPLGHQLISDKIRRTISLPRRKRSKLPLTLESQSRLADFRWLLAKGTVWVARRSLDLLPALVFLVLKESLKSSREFRDPLMKPTVDDQNSKESFFRQRVDNTELEELMKNAYRAGIANNSGASKNLEKDLISFPA